MLEFINKYLLGISVPCSLMAAGIYFLFKLRFFPITQFSQIARALTKNGKASFRALALSLAGTLGVGNIVGVASAIYSGGFGAIFWMWVSALVAAILKYAEIVLAMRRRVPSESGFKGGAMYYIRSSLSEKFPKLGKVLAAVFAFFCIINCFSMGAVMQTNAISEAFSGAWNVSGVFCGLALAAVTFFILCGGSKYIMALTSALVPFLSVLYIVMSLGVIIPRAQMLPSVLKQIFVSAFTPESAAGGIFGFLLSRALRFGVMRGLFSNEAGCGTSPTAHISSESAPCEQGFMGIVEVFIDTVLLCSMTGFAVMLRYSEVAHLGESPMKMVLKAYSGAFTPLLGNFIEGAMAFMVLCFGFATVSCLSHYAFECLEFLLRKKTGRGVLIFLYCGAVFLGAVTDSAWAWAVSDLTVGTMTLVNLAVLLYCRDEIAGETQGYFAKKKNISCFDKKFTKSS